MNKENVTRPIGIRLPPTLFEQLEKKCRENYKTVSETVRELVVKYIKEEK